MRKVYVLFLKDLNCRFENKKIVIKKNGEKIQKDFFKMKGKDFFVY